MILSFSGLDCSSLVDRRIGKEGVGDGRGRGRGGGGWSRTYGMRKLHS